MKKFWAFLLSSLKLRVTILYGIVVLSLVLSFALPRLVQAPTFTTTSTETPTLQRTNTPTLIPSVGVTLQGINDGQSLNEGEKIFVLATTSQTVDTVDFLIDKKLTWRERQFPYSLGGDPNGTATGYNPDSIPVGNHTLQAVATLSGTKYYSKTINFVTGDKLFPDDAVINVKTKYGAKGDGVTDDTQAILTAIRKNVGKAKTLYFPKGTYLVSDRLDWRDKSGKWQSGLTLQGQNRATTVIKLKDGVLGFGDPVTPKGVIHTASHLYGSYGAALDGAGVDAFQNNIYDLTVDTGKGNVGAIGIDYVATNCATIRNVTIRSGDGQGRAGLALLRYGAGPLLVHNLQIEGFDYGVDVANMEPNPTFEYLTLLNQRIAAIRNSSNSLSLRKVTSQNRVSAILNVAVGGTYPGVYGFITLVDSELTGGDFIASAIRNDAHSNGKKGGLYVRNVTTSGYRSAIENYGIVIPGNFVTEFVSHPPLGGALSTSAALALPIEETPKYHDNNLSNWASVTAFGAKPDDYGDDSDAIQQALNSGKSTIYFPTGTYYVTKILHVGGKVRRVLGMGSAIEIGPNSAFTNSANPQAVFRFEPIDHSTVSIERFNLQRWTQGYETPGGIWLQHANPQTLILRDLNNYPYAFQYFYSNTAGAGKLFIENVASINAWHFDYPQDVWARQFDPEGHYVPIGSPLVYKSGGRFWILGIKIEGQKSVIKATEGARVELLGGNLVPGSDLVSNLAAFIGRDASLKLSFSSSAYKLSSRYPVIVEDSQGSTVSKLLLEKVPERGWGSMVPLYIGKPVSH